MDFRWTPVYDSLYGSPKSMRVKNNRVWRAWTSENVSMYVCRECRMQQLCLSLYFLGALLLHVAACCRAMLRVAACCSVLQCVAVCCSILPCVAELRALSPRRYVLQCVATLRTISHGHWQRMSLLWKYVSFGAIQEAVLDGIRGCFFFWQSTRLFNGMHGWFESFDEI